MLKQQNCAKNINDWMQFIKYHFEAIAIFYIQYITQKHIFKAEKKNLYQTYHMIRMYLTFMKILAFKNDSKI